MSIERLDEIFELLKQGRKAHEIDQVIEERARDRSSSEGYLIETKVAEAVSGVSFVKYALNNAPRSEEDRRGNDILVVFYPESKHNNLSIQVKSSRNSYLRFLESEKNANSERRITIWAKLTDSNSQVRRIFLGKLKELDGFI